MQEENEDGDVRAGNGDHMEESGFPERFRDTLVQMAALSEEDGFHKRSAGRQSAARDLERLFDLIQEPAAERGRPSSRVER